CTSTPPVTLVVDPLYDGARTSIFTPAFLSWSMVSPIHGVMTSPSRRGYAVTMKRTFIRCCRSARAFQILPEPRVRNGHAVRVIDLDRVSFKSAEHSEGHRNAMIA